jgi:hypothetical protein
MAKVRKRTLSIGQMQRASRLLQSIKEWQQVYDSYRAAEATTSPEQLFRTLDAIMPIWVKRKGERSFGFTDSPFRADHSYQSEIHKAFSKENSSSLLPRQITYAQMCVWKLEVIAARIMATRRELSEIGVKEI